ncbi:unnamed protein product, partial [Musa textilis]
MSPEQRTPSPPRNIIGGCSMTRACSRPAPPSPTRCPYQPRPSRTSPPSSDSSQDGADLHPACALIYTIAS